MKRGIPVVISTNGLGMPVTPVASNAPLAVVSDNGRGQPIVITDNGIPFVVEGLSNITGGPPIINPLDAGGTLSSGVVWGTYTSPDGPVTTTQQMRLNGGGWTAYDGDTIVAAAEKWQVRVIADDSVSQITLVSNVVIVPSDLTYDGSAWYDGSENYGAPNG